MSNCVLFLNENPLPKIFTQGSISGKELRLRSAQDFIDKVYAIALSGKVVESGDQTIGGLEKKIRIYQTIKWPYYLSPIILFVYGLYYVWKLKPKIIEAESPILSGVAAVLLGKLFRIPVLVEVRASYDELIKMRLKFLPLQLKKVGLNTVEKFVFKRATVIVANSKTYQQQIKAKGFDSVVINPGLQYPSKHPVNKKRKVIGYLGRLVPEKGVDYLLRACKLIEVKLVKDGWSIEIAGDGPEREKLERIAARLFKHSKVKVKFLGFTNNFEALSRFSILVNPCLVLHPLEMVNVEAAYMHLPVVCFGNKDIPETVEDRKTGIKVRNRNHNMLAKGILEITNKTFNGNDYESMVANYLFENQAYKLRKIYEKTKINRMAL